MSTSHQLAHAEVTHYPSGSVRKLFLFSLPLILALLSQSVILFFDRFFLAHHSLRSLEICTAAQALCILFQLPCMRIMSIGQVFVGQQLGASRFSLIGPVIWQMIWFSCLSMLVILPIGLGLEGFFFAGSSVPEGVHYFRLLLGANFLFPLSSSLISFYLGIGQNRVIIYSQFITHSIHILLSYFLIHGVEGVIPSLGFRGAAYAIIFSQALLCAILLFFFLKPANRRTYHSHDFRFQKGTFFEIIQIGLPKAIARFCVLAVWTCNMHLMMKEGEVYLAVVAFGSTLVGTFIFINEGMSQGLVSLASQFIGGHQFSEVWKLYRSSFLFSLGTISLLTLPLIFFPDFTIALFFKSSDSPLSQSLLRKTCFWIWVLLISNAVNLIGVSFLTASKDTFFHMMANLSSWGVCYLPVWVMIHLWHWSAEWFWIVLAAEPLIIASILHLRLSKEKWKREVRIQNP